MFQYFDYGATFLWAISGAVLGARRGFDVVGVLTVALVSAAGGGLLRDGFFMQDGPPRLLMPAPEDRHALTTALAGHRAAVGPPVPIFTKLDTSVVDEELARLAPPGESA